MCECSCTKALRPIRRKGPNSCRAWSLSKSCEQSERARGIRTGSLAQSGAARTPLRKQPPRLSIRLISGTHLSPFEGHQPKWSTFAISQSPNPLRQGLPTTRELICSVNTASSKWGNAGKTGCRCVYLVKLPAPVISGPSTRSLRRRPYFRFLCTSLPLGRDTAVESVPFCRP